MKDIGKGKPMGALGAVVKKNVAADTPLSTLCCCGCGTDASKSRHYCEKTKFRIMAFCMMEQNDVQAEEGDGSIGICRRCARILE
jgi:hypothetical protein